MAGDDTIDEDGTVKDNSDNDDKSTGSAKSMTAVQKRRDRKKARKKAKSPVDKQEVKASTFKGSTPDIEDHVFLYDGKERVQRWMRSREKFIDFVGQKFGKDAKMSIVSKKPTVISVKTAKTFSNEEVKELKEERQ